MHLLDTRLIGASPATVWAALLDPEVLRVCVPGCESMVGTAEGGFEAVVVQKVGPVSARFTGVVTLSEMVAGQSLRISGEGKGGPAGFARGGAQVTLTPADEGTLLGYEVEAHVGGKIAQLGSRIIDGFAKKMADEFFTRFQAAVEAPDPSDPPDPPDPVEEPGSDATGAPQLAGGEAVAADGKKKGWFKRLIG